MEEVNGLSLGTVFLELVCEAGEYGVRQAMHLRCISQSLLCNKTPKPCEGNDLKTQDLSQG